MCFCECFVCFCSFLCVFAHFWMFLNAFVGFCEFVVYFCALRVHWGCFGPLLGRAWALLGRSWALLGRSWRLLGHSWDALEPLLGPSWAYLAKNLENNKKNHFFRPQLGRRNGGQNQEKSMLKSNMLSNTFFYRMFSVFLQFLDSNFDGFSIDFWTRSQNVDFVKIVLPPAREHDF